MERLHKSSINGFIIRDSEQYLLYKIDDINTPIVTDIVELGEIDSNDSYEPIGFDEMNLVNWQEDIISEELSTYQIQDLAVVKLGNKSTDEPWLENESPMLYEDIDFIDDVTDIILSIVNDMTDDDGYIMEKFEWNNI